MSILSDDITGSGWPATPIYIRFIWLDAEYYKSLYKLVSEELAAIIFNEDFPLIFSEDLYNTYFKRTGLNWKARPEHNAYKHKYDICRFGFFIGKTNIGTLEIGYWVAATNITKQTPHCFFSPNATTNFPTD